MKRLGVLAAVLLLAGCSGAAATPSPSPTPAMGTITFAQASYSCATGMFTEMKWTATLPERIGALKATVIVAKKGANGTERVIEEGDVPVSDPDSETFSADGANVWNTCQATGAGDYVMRIARPSDAKVLAEGSVTIAP